MSPSMSSDFSFHFDYVFQDQMYINGSIRECQFIFGEVINFSKLGIALHLQRKIYSKPTLTNLNPFLYTNNKVSVA